MAGNQCETAGEGSPANQEGGSARSIPENVKNVLVIMTDQHRVDSIGCPGNPYAKTPSLDRIGEEGFAFTNAWTPTAICTPARSDWDEVKSS